ncbi:MAG TPA: cupin domain-containing protein [Burkholderiaceae bacterium]|nr:cupin domain-containing protein [Burkholderiaceae bacterium]
MDVKQPLPLLGSLNPEQFMKRHWQKKPLVIRQAIPGFKALLDRVELFALAARDEVESRVVSRGSKGWQLRRGGPMPRRALPPLKQRDWTLLVQGVDLHHEGVHKLLQQFRFVPEARMDDLMISYATDGGGVGAHFDSYDVFLLQAHGQRRWRIGRQKDLRLQRGVPLKILANFSPEEEFVLDPGDMLYLPPRYAHDGEAIGECMTYSIGFRAPQRAELARELLPRMVEDVVDAAGSPLYRDPGQAATGQPGEIPPALLAYAHDALMDVFKDPRSLPRALGEYLTEPKDNVWFDPVRAPSVMRSVVLDRRTRMMFDAHHVFINGESYRASGRDAALMRQLADQRRLDTRTLQRGSAGALALLQEWCEAGWLHDSHEGGSVAGA